MREEEEKQVPLIFLPHVNSVTSASAFDKLSVSYRCPWQAHWSFLHSTRGWLPSLSRVHSHPCPFCFPPLPLLTPMFHAVEASFKKYIFLITYLPGEGCASMLGWVSKKKPHSECRVSSPSLGDSDKEKWVLYSAPIQDGCWCGLCIPVVRRFH